MSETKPHRHETHRWLANAGKFIPRLKQSKGSSLSHRMYTDNSILNGSCLEWLERTVNSKVQGTTKLVLAEVF